MPSPAGIHVIKNILFIADFVPLECFYCFIPASFRWFIQVLHGCFSSESLIKHFCSHIRVYIWISWHIKYPWSVLQVSFLPGPNIIFHLWKTVPAHHRMTLNTVMTKKTFFYNQVSWLISQIRYNWVFFVLWILLIRECSRDLQIT